MVEFTGHDGKVVKQMAIKPILFNTEMVRAILDGRKSCTRRLVKHDVESVLNSPYHKAHPEVEDKQIISKLCNPPYQLGDIIYIRETWACVRVGIAVWMLKRPDAGTNKSKNTMVRKRNMDVTYTVHRVPTMNIHRWIRGTHPSTCRKERHVSG